MIWIGDNRKRKSGAIRINNWKLVLDKRGNNHLFNIEKDPLEEHNLIQEEEDKYQNLLEVFNKYVEDFPPPITNRNK